MALLFGLANAGVLHGGLGYSTLGGIGIAAPVHSYSYGPGYVTGYTGLGLGGIGLGYGTGLGLGGLGYAAAIPIGK